ncbi:hypothetical protein LCGC14_3147170 [marine sediment metagenome]|uniref:Uncharacterized protein n=1 Tax=marine sediment metagenome TaxID=412755 RepID=A0A0F8WJ43_9ZZZZ
MELDKKMGEEEEKSLQEILEDIKVWKEAIQTITQILDTKVYEDMHDDVRELIKKLKVKIKKLQVIFDNKSIKILDYE